MRLLHTSDWHLGRSLHGVDLLEHQAAYLDHLLETARAERVDAVVVAGDVYDRAIPPVEAVELLSGTLARLAELTTVVVTPGNHDSATRLGFGSAVMRDRVRVRARVATLADPVVLPDDAGDVLLYGLPYLDPDVARHALGDVAADGTVTPTGRSHEAVLAAAMARVRADAAGRGGAGARPRAVVLAHAFVSGGRASESERDIRVGGVDVAPADVFAGVDYVALGHLHGAQQVAGPAGTVLRYSGSPLAYACGEVDQVKSTVLVELGAPGSGAHGAGGTVRTELVPAPVPRRLSEVTGTLDDLLGAGGEGRTADWVRVSVTDAHRPPDLFRRVRDRFPHALVVQHRPPGGVLAHATAREVTPALDPVGVARDFVAHVTGAAPTDAELRVLRRATEDALAAERSA